MGSISYFIQYNLEPSLTFTCQSGLKNGINSGLNFTMMISLRLQVQE